MRTSHLRFCSKRQPLADHKLRCWLPTIILMSFAAAHDCDAAEVEKIGFTQPAISEGQDLSDEKLRQETRKLTLENDRLQSRWSYLSTAAPFITALVAVLGVMLTLWKQINETSRRRKEELDFQERESLRRFDEKFTTAVENLGSESVAIQASAPATLRTFLKPRYEEFYEDVFLVLEANIKIDRARVVEDLLTRVFQDAVRLKLIRIAERAASDKQADGKVQNEALNMSRGNLARVNFQGYDFTHCDVDIGYADMRGANLTAVILPRVRGYNVNLEKARLSRADLKEARLNRAVCNKTLFHNCNLVSATLKESELRSAEFFQARMQELHLEKADIRGAKFEEANLDNAYFYGAIVDDAALKSIKRAKNWQKANFDNDVVERLKSI